MGWGKIGGEKMCGVSGNNGLGGNEVEIFPPVRELQLRQFCTAVNFIDVQAWIPDTLRSFLAHEVENDELVVCPGGKPPTLEMRRAYWLPGGKPPTLEMGGARWLPRPQMGRDLQRFLAAVLANHQRLRLAASLNAIRHSRPR